MGRAITKDVFRKIEQRFQKKYGIRIQNHIVNLSGVKVGRDTGAGITFTAKSTAQLVLALQSTKNFRKDDRSELFGAVAAAATNGEGWREMGKPGEPSLHCQIAKSSCNIHIDRIGFTAQGPDGKVYAPDAIPHVFDELLMAKAANAAHRVSPILGEFVSRIHPILPNAHNRYKLDFGGQIEIASGENTDLTKRWKLTFDLTKTCKNFKCGSGAVYGGLTLKIVR